MLRDFPLFLFIPFTEHWRSFPLSDKQCSRKTNELSCSQTSGWSPRDREWRESPYLRARGLAQPSGTHSPLGSSRIFPGSPHKALVTNVNQAPETYKFSERWRCKSWGRTSKAKKNFSWRESSSLLGINRDFTMDKRGLPGIQHENSRIKDLWVNLFSG